MADVIIRSVDPRDESDVERVVDEAFSGHAEYELIAALRVDDDAWVADLSLGAYRGNELMGHVLYTPASVGGMPAVLLAPLAVVPAHQRQGVGGALVRAGLEAGRGTGAVLALVLGHPEYYPRFGFEPAYPHGILPPYAVEPEAAWMVSALVPGALDLARGTVTLAAAFRNRAMWRE